MLARLVIAVSLIAIAIAGVVWLRAERDLRPAPLAEARTIDAIAMNPIRPGGDAPPSNAANAPYAPTGFDVAEGQRLYKAYNCNGCHAAGGGGIGPALMDETWIYGSEPGAIYRTIVEGHPNGM